MPQSSIFDHFSPRSRMTEPEAPFSPSRTGTGVGSRSGGSQSARFRAHFQSSPTSPSRASGGGSGNGLGRTAVKPPGGSRKMRQPGSVDSEEESDDDFALDRITLTQRAEPLRSDRKGKRRRRVHDSSDEDEHEEGEDGSELSGGDEGKEEGPRRSRRKKVQIQDESVTEGEDEGPGRSRRKIMPIQEKSDSESESEEVEVIEKPIRGKASAAEAGPSKARGGMQIDDIPEEEGSGAEQEEQETREPADSRSTRSTRSTRTAATRSTNASTAAKSKAPTAPEAVQMTESGPSRRSTRRPAPIVLPQVKATRSTRTSSASRTASHQTAPSAAPDSTTPSGSRSARASSRMLSVELPPMSAAEKARYSLYVERAERGTSTSAAGSGEAAELVGENALVPKRRDGEGSSEAESGQALDRPASAMRGMEGVVGDPNHPSGQGDDQAASPSVEVGADAAARSPTPPTAPVLAHSKFASKGKGNGRSRSELPTSPVAHPTPIPGKKTARKGGAATADSSGEEGIEILPDDGEVEIVQPVVRKDAADSRDRGMATGKQSATAKPTKRRETMRPAHGDTSPRGKTGRSAGANKAPQKRPRSDGSSSSSSSNSSSTPPPARNAKKSNTAARRKGKAKDPDESLASSDPATSDSDSSEAPARRKAAKSNKGKQPAKAKSSGKAPPKKGEKQKRKHDPDSSGSASTSEEDMVAEIEMDEAERFRTDTRLRRKKKETPAQRSMRKLRARRLGIIEVTSSSSSSSSDSSSDDSAGNANGLMRALSYDSGDESDYVKARSQRVERNRAQAIVEEKARRVAQAKARKNGIPPNLGSGKGPQDAYDIGSDSDDFIEDDGGVVPDHLMPHQFSLNSTQSPEYKYKVVFHYLLLLVMGGPKTLPLKGELKEYLMPNLRDLRRRLGGLKDGSVRSQIWRTDFVRALDRYPQFDTEELVYAEPGCDACHISTRMSTKRVQMGGYPYNKDTHGPLDSSSEDSDSDDSDASNKKGPPNFLLGKFCHARARAYHALAHWEDDLYERIKGYYHDLLRAMDKPVPDDSEASGSSSDSDSSGDVDDAGRTQLIARRARTVERVKRLKQGRLVKRGKERDVNEVMAWMDAKGYPKQTFIIMENLTRTATNLENDKSKDD